MTDGQKGSAPHRYEEIAADLRSAIERGDFPEGSRLPSENDIIRDYDVARNTARDALGVIRHEGLAVAKQGSGTVVTPRKKIKRDSRGRYSRTRARVNSPFERDAASAGQRGDWEADSVRTKATPEVARRLDIKPGSPVRETTYRFFADQRPIQVSRSWEPLSITGDTPVEDPEESPVIGVIARMDTIGQHVDHVVEQVTARAATRDEVDRLNLATRGAYVLVIERTHYVGDLPVETCDIIFPGDRYELTYDIPVQLEP
ncbi:GntR family transcriptional regulator [Kribbella sp. NPDC020789]